MRQSARVKRLKKSLRRGHRGTGRTRGTANPRDSTQKNDDHRHRQHALARRAHPAARRPRRRAGAEEESGRDEAAPKKLFNPDSGELFDPEEEARQAQAEAARAREERRRAAEAKAALNKDADEWRPADALRNGPSQAPGFLGEEDFPALPMGGGKPAVSIRRPQESRRPVVEQRRPPPAPKAVPSGPRFRGKVIEEKKGGREWQGWVRPDGAKPGDQDVLLFREHVVKGTHLKQGDRVAYSHAPRKTSHGKTVAVHVTKEGASAAPSLRRAPASQVGARVADVGLPSQRQAAPEWRRQAPTDGGLQQALAASRQDVDAMNRSLEEKEDEDLAKAMMLSAAASEEDARRRREQEAAEAERRAASMAQAKREAASSADAEAERRVAEVVVAGTTNEPRAPSDVVEAERRAAAARAQLDEIERARKSAAEELRASQNAIEDARRRAARDARVGAPLAPRSPPRSLAALEQQWGARTPGTPSTVRKHVTLGTRPAFDSKQRDFVAFLASIDMQHYAKKLRQEQIDCIADLQILNDEDLEACGIPPEAAKTMMAGLADLHPSFA